MGEHELREALRGKAQARIRQLWQASEAAVAGRRVELEAEQATLRAEAERQHAAAAAVTRRNLLAGAELKAQQHCLETEEWLQQRLYALATNLLAELGRSERQQLWPALVEELPAAEWQRIRVHPDDLPAARERFPTVEVVADPALAGGLVAETGDGRIVVDNSLNGRLTRAWPELLAPLFAAIHKEVDRDAAGPAATD